MSVTGDDDTLRSPARNAELWSVRGAQMPRDQEEETMIEQRIEAIAPGSAKPRPRKQTPKPKSEMLRKLLLRRNGATVPQIQKQLGWQPHTIRAAISRLRSSGVQVELDRFDRNACYRLLRGDDR